MKTNYTQQDIADISNYNLKASNGSHIRVATKVTMRDGSEIRFNEHMSKRQAIAQFDAPAWVETDYGTPHRENQRAKLAAYRRFQKL